MEMEDSLADDSANLERDSKEMDHLRVEGAAIAEDSDTIAKYQYVPAESDTSMDIADVAVLDRDSNEVLCIVMENSQFACSLLGHEGNCAINTVRRRHSR